MKFTLLSYSKASKTFEISIAFKQASSTTTYSRGSNLLGSARAPEGEIPQEGTLLEGSYIDGYCVLEIEGTPYYYMSEKVVPTTWNKYSATIVMGEFAEMDY
jgi:hypothetical protein